MTLTVYRGDYKTIRATLSLSSTGTAPDLTGAKIVATVGDGTTPVVTRRNTAAGGSDAEVAIVTAASGILDVKLTEANTGALIGGNGYTLEIAVKLADTHEYVAAHATLRCLARQTPAIT